MGKLRPIQCNFTAGEWSPLLHDRPDLEKYWNAAETLENWIILPQGGVRRRPGWHFVAEVRDSTRKGRLIPFIFSNQQAYIIEASEQKYRFFMNHGQIQAIPSTIKFLAHCDGSDGSTSFIDSSAGGHTITAHGTAQLDVDQKKFGPTSALFGNSGDFLSVADHSDFDFSGGIWGISFWYYPMAKVNGTMIYRQATDASNYIQIDQYISGSEPLTSLLLRFKIVSGGTTLVQMISPAPGLSMHAWNFVAVVENGDNYYLWLAGGLSSSTPSASRPANYTGTPMFGGGGGASINGWLDEFCIHNGDAPFVTAHTPPTTPWGISGAESPYELTTPYNEEDLPDIKTEQSADTQWQVHGSYKPRKLTRTGHTAWSIDAISFTSMPDWSDEKGWPRACAFNEQRMAYAGTDTYPTSVWLSQSGSYDDFSVSDPVVDSDGFMLTIPASQVDVVNWLVSIDAGLIAGSTGGLARIFADGGLTPSSNNTKGVSPIRASSFSPVKIGNVVLFLQKYGRKINEFVWNDPEQGFHSPDITILSEHITEGKVFHLVYQAEPYYILWGRRGDGQLLQLSYYREENVVGWGRMVTAGIVESHEVIPDPTGSRDEVWAIINRTIGGVTKRYIEYQDPDLMVDSGITYSGVPTNTVSGLDHLEGETVDIIGDGCVYPQKTVEDGSVTLDGPAAGEISVGLHYKSRLVSMKPNVPNQGGTIAGLPKGWAEVWVSLFESNGLTINGEVLPFRKVGDLAGAAIVPFTGLKQVAQLGFNEGRITIEQDQPLPCTIRAIFGSLVCGQ